MKKTGGLLVLMLASYVLFSQESPQIPGEYSGGYKSGFNLKYLLYLPDEYQQETAGQFPLLVFLHGSGERGDDLAKVKVHGPPKLIDLGQKFPFVVLSPRCPASKDWDVDAVYSLIKKIATEYRIDETRVYVTGLSMGGWATWDIAMAYPGYFAAIAPVCGRVNRNYPERAAELKSLAIWAFHGAADDVVPILESARMIRALRNAGNEALFTIYPTAGHDSWTETYDNPELYRWMMQQKRKF